MNRNILRLMETPLVPGNLAEVNLYFEEIKGSHTGWKKAIKELSLSYSSVYLSDKAKFFCWRIVEDFIKTRYAHLETEIAFPDLETEIARFGLMETEIMEIEIWDIRDYAQWTCPSMKDFLLKWLHDMSISAKEESSFSRNKAAQVFSLVFIVDFPRRWQSFLVDFLQTLKLGPKAVDFYLRVLKEIDSEVVDREIPHSKEEADRNALIKDRIRETCINDLVNSWYEICVKYEMSDSWLVNECLCVICAYISWIDISLIANERFYTLFIRFMKDQHLRESTCDCLCEIVAKGMDLNAKVKLIESLYSLLHGAGVFLIDNEEDSDYLCKLGKLINTMFNWLSLGFQLAVSWTRIEGPEVEPSTQRLQLQRSYFSFIAAVCENHLVEVLSSQDTNFMQQVLITVIQGATELDDPMAQKDCYSILKKLVELWGNNGPPDFVEFLYNQIVPACFLGPLRETFDLLDAQTLLALNEASACLKLIYDQKGEEAIEFLQSQYLPRLDLPAPKILEFCQALRMEAKLFKQFLWAFFLEAKL